jgi:6-pyruvoyltetrahydropterin/6-carboxytetrahydropterin synthase
MPKIRITKKFSFEMAHALWNYDGPCKNIHGHSYKLWVTIIGEPLNDIHSKKNGMIIDFNQLKDIIKRVIINKFDHSVVVNNNAPYHMLEKIEQMFDNYIALPYQPTCEMLICDFAKMIQQELPPNVKLYSLKLAETDNSYAEWYSQDNE